MLISIVILGVTEIGTSQITLDMSPAHVTYQGGLDLSEMTVAVRNSVQFNGEVELQIYIQPYTPASEPLYTSRRFYLEGSNGFFYFEDLFNKSELPLDQDLDRLCMVLYDRMGHRALGIHCINLIKNPIHANKNKIVNKKNRTNNKWLDYSGSLGYEANYAQGQYVEYQGGQEWYHTLEADAELSIKQMPINFKALYSNNDDPYLGYDLNRVTSYFDVQKWRAVLRQKANKILDQKKHQLLEKYPEYGKYKAKYDMVQRILSNNDVEKEIKDLEKIPDRLKELNLSDAEELLRKTDWMAEEMEQIEKKKAELLSSMDSTTAVISQQTQQRIDSLNQIKTRIESEYKDLEYVQSLVLKSEGYQKIMNLRDSSEVYIAKARKVEDKFNTYRKDVLNNPAKMYDLVKDRGLTEDQSEFLSRIDELRIGVVHPNYSELSLQHGQQKGFAFGYSGSIWSVHTFLAKNQARGIGSPNLDTLGNDNSPMLIGGKITLQPTENLETSIFTIHSLSTLPYPTQTTKSHLGLIQRIELSEDQKIDAEFVWSGNNEPISIDTEGNPTATAFRKALQEMAMRGNYEGRSPNKKLKYAAEVEYYGPRYFDFNDSFIRRNTIQLSADGRYSIKPDVWIGGNTSFDFGNIWSTASSLNGLYSFGVHAGIAKPELPSVQYLFQFSKADYDEVDIQTTVHNTNVQKAYGVGDGQWNSIINLSLTENLASIDTLNTTITGIFLSQQIEVPSLATVIMNGNYSRISFTERLEQDWSAEVRLPLQIAKLQMTAGLKWIHTADQGDLGWSLDAHWPIHKKINISVLMDSLWLSSKEDQFGQIVQQYNANYQLKLKYNL